MAVATVCPRNCSCAHGIDQTKRQSRDSVPPQQVRSQAHSLSGPIRRTTRVPLRLRPRRDPCDRRCASNCQLSAVRRPWLISATSNGPLTTDAFSKSRSVGRLSVPRHDPSRLTASTGGRRAGTPVTARGATTRRASRQQLHLTSSRCVSSRPCDTLRNPRRDPIRHPCRRDSPR